VRDAQTGALLHELPVGATHLALVDNNVWAARVPVLGDPLASRLALDIYDTGTYKVTARACARVCVCVCVCMLCFRSTLNLRGAVLSHVEFERSAEWRQCATAGAQRIAIVGVPEQRTGACCVIVRIVLQCVPQMRIVDAQAVKVVGQATLESPVVSHTTGGTRLWLAHADGTITVWDRERAQHLETLSNLAGDGMPAVALQMCAFGASRVLGVVRDAVIAWDAMACERIASARGYAGGNNTSLCAAYNTRAARYYAWTGHSDGSVCVWALRQAGLGLLPPDLAALRKRFPNLRVSARDDNRSSAMLSPRDSVSHLPVRLCACYCCTHSRRAQCSWWQLIRGQQCNLPLRVRLAVTTPAPTSPIRSRRVQARLIRRRRSRRYARHVTISVSRACAECECEHSAADTDNARARAAVSVVGYHK
jgi:hypothetical protein